MRLLVIGGAGYVGRLVLPGLALRHRVRVLDLRRPDGDGDHESVTGDAADPAVLARACAGMDAVLHMAMAPTGPDEHTDPSLAFDVHVKSAYLAVRAAADAGIGHVVFLSSLSVFAELGYRTLGPDEEPDAVEPYGLTKRLGETACRAAALSTGTALTILRLAWPTPDDVWPAWEVGLRSEQYRHGRDGRLGLHRDPPGPDDPLPMLRMGDGRVVPALAGTDLTGALLAALETPDGVRVLPVTGDRDGVAVALAPTVAALGWAPRPRP